MSLLRALWDSINTGATWKIEALKEGGPYCIHTVNENVNERESAWFSESDLLSDDADLNIGLSLHIPSRVSLRDDNIPQVKHFKKSIAIICEALRKGVTFTFMRMYDSAYCPMIMRIEDGTCRLDVSLDGLYFQNWDNDDRLADALIFHLCRLHEETYFHAMRKDEPKTEPHPSEKFYGLQF